MLLKKIWNLTQFNVKASYLLEMNIDRRRRGKRICFGSKQEPYYDKDFDEMDAWAMPEYKYEELSSSERDFYEKTEDA